MKLFPIVKTLNVSACSSYLTCSQTTPFYNILWSALISWKCFAWENDSVNIFGKLSLAIDHRNRLLMMQLILCHFNSLNLFWMCFWSIYHSVIKSYGFGVGMIRWNCRIWVIQKVRLDNHNCSLWPHRLFIFCISPSAFGFKYAWLP